MKSSPVIFLVIFYVSYFMVVNRFDMGSISYNQVQNNSSNDMRAIFESGEQDLLEKTTDLLIHNQGLEKTDDGKTTALPKQTAGAR
ncbi:MAG: hypothetical protein ACLUGF_09355 [Clostridium sp.]|jgi:hypothetical protein